MNGWQQQASRLAFTHTSAIAKLLAKTKPVHCAIGNIANLATLLPVRLDRGTASSKWRLQRQLFRAKSTQAVSSLYRLAQVAAQSLIPERSCVVRWKRQMAGIAAELALVIAVLVATLIFTGL